MSSTVALTSAQKRNLRRDYQRRHRKSVVTTTTTDHGVILHAQGGPFSPYHPQLNPQGNQDVPVPAPGAAPQIVAQRKIVMTADSFPMRLLQLPPTARKIAELLMHQHRVTELVVLMEAHAHLPPADDTRNLWEHLLNQTLTVTVDDQ